GGLRRESIGFFVLRVPGKSCAHNSESDVVLFEQVPFTIVPGAFDKLADTAFLTMADRAGNSAETRGGFAFTVTGNDQQDAFFCLSGSHSGIDFIFDFLLPGFVTILLI